MHSIQWDLYVAGNPECKGVFFPEGVYGAINSSMGYNVTAAGTESFPSSNAQVATQVCGLSLSPWGLLHILCMHFH